jgi:hypothetical protein
MFSPAELAVIIWYHSHVDDCGKCNDDVSFPGITFSNLVEAGLLIDTINHKQQDTRQRFKPTDKLHAYVEILCATPLPVQKWVEGVKEKP